MMRKHALCLAGLIGVGAIVATPSAGAQVRPPSASSSSSSLDRQDDEPSLESPEQQQQQPAPLADRSTPLETNQVGRTARSSAGETGQRQTRDSAATETGVEIMGRVASRIQNRVQNRLRNRIDRTYDPQANANDPFLVAEDQVKTTNRPR